MLIIKAIKSIKASRIKLKQIVGIIAPLILMIMVMLSIRAIPSFTTNRSIHLFHDSTSDSVLDLMLDDDGNYSAIPEISGENDLILFPINSSLPYIDGRYNLDDFTALKNNLVKSHLLDSRTTRIQATFYLALALKNLDNTDATYLDVFKDDIEDYILGCYNVTSGRFEEALDYAYIINRKPQGEMVIYEWESPMTSHQWAILTLAEIGRLESNFNSSIISNWESEILATMNWDGGFGDRFENRSSLHETYLACRVLYSINGFSSTFLSPSLRLKLLEFVESNQYGYISEFPFLEGVFREYDSSNQYEGWDVFEVSREALKIVEYAGLNYSNIKQPFLNFIDANSIFVSSHHQFAAEWNDKYVSTETHQIGTAIIGDCIRILGAEANYTIELNDAYANIQTMYSLNGLSEGANYFYRDALTRRYSLRDQAIMLEYLNSVGMVNSILSEQEKQGIFNYLGGHISNDGGAALFTDTNTTLCGIWQNYSVYSPSELNATSLDVLYNKIYNLFSVDHFLDGSKWNSLLVRDYNSDYYKELKSTYYAIATMNQFGLFDRLYSDIDMAWLDMEQWIANRYAGNGTFWDHSMVGYGESKLQAAFFALVSLDMLFKYNTGSGLSNYFSEADLSDINTFICNTIENGSTSPFWRATDNYIDEFSATYYAQRCLEILNRTGTEINYEKILNYIDWGFDSWDSLEPATKNNLMILADWNDYFSMERGQGIIGSFSIITDGIIAEQIDSNHILYDNMGWLSVCSGIEWLALLTDIPENQYAGNFYTYKFQVMSAISEIPLDSVDSIMLIGKLDVYSEFIGDSLLSLSINSEYDQEHPEYWEPLLEINFGGKIYSSTLHIDYLPDSNEIIDGDDGVNEDTGNLSDQSSDNNGSSGVSAESTQDSAIIGDSGAFLPITFALIISSGFSVFIYGKRRKNSDVKIADES